MNFEFSSEQQQLKNEARRFLADKCSSVAVRAILEGNDSYDRALWAGFAEMGFLGAAIPEEYGGLGLGYLELCVIAEELGRVLAPVPFSSSIFLAAELLKAEGTEAQKQEWLPKIASGDAIGTLAAAECVGALSAASISAVVSDGQLSGCKIPVLDGDVADFAIVLAKEGDTHGPLSLYLVRLDQAGVERKVLSTIDPTRSQSSLAFAKVAVERLGAPGDGWSIFQEALDRAAVLTGFEQIGGADRCLEMAKDYALQRMAFGRPIGSFQAVKHMLADMYVAATLARSNCYFGAWALSVGSDSLSEAAAIARVSSTKAFQLCSRNNIQTHGGMGYTWEFDCHLFYRRANLLAVTVGGLNEWEDKLIGHYASQAA